MWWRRAVDCEKDVDKSGETQTILGVGGKERGFGGLWIVEKSEVP